MERKVISKYTRFGAKFEQVVYLWPNGKKTNGKPAFMSQTKHEKVS